MFRTTPIQVTPELLASAQYTVWHDVTQITGKGIGVAAAPEVFGWDPAQGECLRFGKILGLPGGPATVMPLLPEVYFSAVDAQESAPQDVININPIPEGTDIVSLWHEFFRRQITAVGNLAVGCLMDGAQKSRDNARRTVRGLHYVASVIGHQLPATVGNPTRYDTFDVLSYMGLAGANDIDFRQKLATSLKEVADQIGASNRVDVDTGYLMTSVDELLTTEMPRQGKASVNQT